MRFALYSVTRRPHCHLLRCLTLTICLVTAASASRADDVEAERLRLELTQARAALAAAQTEITRLRAAADAPGDPVVALIDDEALTRSQLAQACFRTYGMAFFDTFINQALVHHAARKAGLTASEQERTAWVDDQVENFAQQVGSAQALESALARQGQTLAAFRYSLEHSAEAAVLIVEMVRHERLTDTGLRREYARRYGEQIELRHVLYRLSPEATDKDRAAAQEAARRSLAKTAQGADFGKLAEQESQDTVTRSRYGLIGTLDRISLEDQWPGLAKAAFDHAGTGIIPQAITTAAGIHLVQILKRHAAKASFDEVKEQLRAEAKAAEPTNADTQVLIRRLRARHHIETRWP